METEIENLTVVITEGEALNRLLEQKEALEERSRILEAKKEEMTGLEQALVKAVSAREVAVYENQWKQMASLSQTAMQKQKESETELMRLSGKIEEGASFFEKQSLLAAAYELKEKISLLEKQKKEAQNIKETREGSLSGLQEGYLAAEEKQRKARECYDEISRGYRLQIAGILASDLEEGAACPVCGSISHPKKATLEQEKITEQMIEEKKALYEESHARCMEDLGKITAEKKLIQEAADRLFELSEEMDKCRQEENAREAFVAGYADTHEKKQFEKELKEYEALLVSLEHTRTTLEERRKEAGELQEKEKHCLAVFEEKCALSFGSDEDYRAAFRTEKESNQMQEQVQAYKQQVQENQVALRQLAEQAGDKKPVALEEIKQNLLLLKETKSRLLLQEKAGSHSLQNAENLSDALNRKLEITGRLSEKYGRIKRLDDTANRNNKMRLMFEQYVLAAYFEEILSAANIRLRVMSTGRYELRRVNEVTDGRSKDNLEMEVFDYYTGKYRSVKTLSGGETFKVSLALALGMSDVVQAGSGGIRVETLFVDEGFGSLDSESLEQACLTLQSLVEKDRLIGIISHVPELSEKIVNRIQIHKSGAGSRAEVVVS